MRRVLVERIRTLLPQFQGGHDILIHAVSSWKKENKDLVVTELEGLFRSSGVL